jgi:hypothetical protein
MNACPSGISGLAARLWCAKTPSICQIAEIGDTPVLPFRQRNMRNIVLY